MDSQAPGAAPRGIEAIVIDLIWAGMLAAGALSAFLLLTVAVRKWPVVGVVAITFNVLVAWEFPQLPAIANVGGTSVYLLDVLSLLFIVIALVDIKRVSAHLGALRWVWAGFGLSMLFSLIVGVVEIEVGKAVNEFRAFFYLFAALSWVVSLDWRKQSTLLLTRVPVVLGWLLVAVAAYHGVRFGFGGAGEFVDPSSGIEQTTRPLVSGQALVLLLCIPLTLRLWVQSASSFLLVSAIAFGAVVVVVQQRTVWAVAAAMVAAFYFSFWGKHRTKSVIAAVLIAWGALVLVTSNVAGDFVGKLIAAANDSATYNARVTSWQNLIEQSFDKGLGTALFGAPFGSGYGRFEGVGRWVEFAPHNWYVTLFVRVGLVGTALFLFFVLGAIYRVLKSNSDVSALLVLVATLVYGWAYSVAWYTAIFLGWAVIVGRDTTRAEESKEQQLIPLPLAQQRQLRVPIGSGEHD